jgi:hypothetical protein
MQDFTINYESIWRPEPGFAGLARSRAPSFTINGKAYVGMGSNLIEGDYYNDWWEFDGTSWIQKASFPEPESQGETQAGSANGKGFIGLHNREKKWWQYDPVANSWERKADFPGPSRFSHFIISLNDKIYLGGGSGDSGPLLDFWEYDPVTNLWTEKSPLPQYSLGGSLAFSHNGKGHTFSRVGTNYSTLSYDPATNEWSAQPLSGVTYGLSSDWKLMKFDDQAVLQAYQFTRTPLLFKFVPETNSLKEFTTNDGAARSTPTTFVINGRGYIGLGYQNGYLSNFWSFNPAMLQLAP